MSVRHTPRFAAGAALLLLAAACGGGDDAATGGDAASASPTRSAVAPAARGSDGVLKLGYVLSETGPLSGLAPGIVGATKLAVADVNAAGGVLGKPVTLVGGDEAGDQTIAGQTVDRLLAEKVDGIIGPVASAISLSVIDKITGAGALQCAGANTSRTFTDYDDRGLYFRTIPANVKQAPVLGNAVIGDGASRVAVVTRNDDYGKSLSDALVETLESEGAEVVAKVPYDPSATTFSAEVAQLKSANPDAVVVVAFQEGALILRTMIESGLGPKDVKVFGTDGMSFGALAAAVDKTRPDVIEGMQGTQSSSLNDPAFLKRLTASSRGIKVTNFAPYHYDCVVTVALAATAAKSDDPSKIQAQMVPVTRDGTKCKTFKECAALLAKGEDVDYEGVSGPLDFTEVGEPAAGLYDVVRFDAKGVPTVVETVKSEG